MTEEKIKQLIQYNSRISGDPGLDAAEVGFSAALEAIGKIDYVPWNKIATTTTLTSGTGIYALEDLIADVQDITGVLQIWRTDTEGWNIPIYTIDRFNSYKRGVTTSGKPYCAMVYRDTDGDNKVEFYETPDDNYPLWVLVSKPLKLEDMDAAYHEMLVWKGVMMIGDPKDGYYEKAEREFAKAEYQLKSVGFNKWNGTQIQPGYLLGQRSSGTSYDSGNYWGLR
jgi:hypothetical protein